jgi:hypothetical protein
VPSVAVFLAQMTFAQEVLPEPVVYLFKKKTPKKSLAQMTFASTSRATG